MDGSEARDHSAAAPPPTPAADVAEPSSRRGPELEEPSFPPSPVECFECCICLDLIYKPIVLACGHISCFWCVHRAMDGVMHSHCPMCRQPYKYFPAICQLLHNLLQKIDSAAYKKREKEVLEIERRQECFSPQFVDQFTEGSPLVEQSTFSAIDAPQDNGSVDLDGSAIDGHIISKEGKLLEDGLPNKYSQDPCVSDALCVGCKQLLFQPAVLNCGHVYCEPCLLSLGGETPRCQICQSVHPGDLPKACLQLSSFLEKRFPKEYALRRESFPDLSSCVCEANKHDPQLDDHKQALSVSMEDMLKIHVQVGCDSCGMYPIVGKRYKCKDCKERVGFDLCESCYDTRSKLPARFNQQHTPDHTFELDESMILSRIYRGVIRHNFDEDSGDSAETEIPDHEA